MELRELQDQLSGRVALEAELEALNQQKNALQDRMKREKVNLEYEQSDVEALEGNTLKAVFYSVIGQKEVRLAKEEDEAEAAKRKYEGTCSELEAVNARIKRVEFELRELKRIEQDYKRRVGDLLVAAKEMEPRMSPADAIALEAIQKELVKQKRNRDYYTEIIEEGEKLKFYIQLVKDALWEVIDEDRAGTAFGEYAAEKEAQERRELVAVQAQRLQACIAKGVNFINDYSFDMKSIDNMITGVVIACNGHSDGPVVYDRLSNVPDLGLNLQGMLHELERKIERSKRFQSELEGRLSDLIQKYQKS